MSAIELLMHPIGDGNQVDPLPMPADMKLAGPVGPTISGYCDAISMKSRQIADLIAQSAASGTTEDKNRIFKEHACLKVEIDLLKSAIVLEIWEMYPDIVGETVGICPEGIWYHERQDCQCVECKIDQKAKELDALLTTAKARESADLRRETDELMRIVDHLCAVSGQQESKCPQYGSDEDLANHGTFTATIGKPENSESQSGPENSAE